ncbi:hypothetical protein F3C99_11905 [Vitellibacter sp. q18]|nr:hypothetical protein [Aequorivita lutea]
MEIELTILSAIRKITNAIRIQRAEVTAAKKKNKQGSQLSLKEGPILGSFFMFLKHNQGDLKTLWKELEKVIKIAKNFGHCVNRQADSLLFL